MANSNIKDYGYKRFTKQIENLKKYEVAVGVLAKEGKQMVTIAAANEFGASIPVTKKMRGFLASQGFYLKASTTKITIPERSYIRASAKVHAGDYKGFFEDLVNDLIQTKGLSNIEHELNRLGLKATGDIKKFMVDLKQPPNHPFTIQQKKSDNPLNDTGRLRNSINHKLRKKGAID